MVLSQKEMATIEDLKTQEQSCIKKYSFYEKEASDQVLKDLFKQLAESEQKHYDTLCHVAEGIVPQCNCNDNDGKQYNPTATYKSGEDSEEKKKDCFLVTDCIGTEKLVSGEYNSNVFIFGNSNIRKILADIQIEEQNHAEMMWKYKTVNGMA